MGNGGQITKSVYVADSQRERSVETVGRQSPIFDTYQGSEYPDEKGHSYEFVNRFKVCELCIFGSEDPRVWSEDKEGNPQVVPSKWGNWRTKTHIGVSSNVFLLLGNGNNKFSFNYHHNFKSAYEDFSQGFIEKAQGGLNLLRGLAGDDAAGGKARSRFQKGKAAWDSSEPIKYPPLKFEFKFGQAGIFSARHEVVNPILALALLFLPQQAKGKDGLPMKNMFIGPLPTVESYFATFVSSIVNGGGDVSFDDFNDAMRNVGTLAKEGVSALFSGDFAPSDDMKKAVSDLTDFEQKILQAVDNSIVTTLSGHTHTNQGLFFRIGRMIFGPAIVQDVQWDFDFTHTDEFGFPFQGSITLNNLENIQLPQENHVMGMWYPPPDQWGSGEPKGWDLGYSK